MRNRIVIVERRKRMDVAQAAPFVQAMTYESGILDYEDFPATEEPVWVLGTQYSALYDREEIKSDITSRIWITYRRGFAPIGGTGPTSDTGWGCMLRCGQMMLAQALLNRHLGRDWRWKSSKYDPKYEEILRLFQDRKGSCYSIHQIASMGVTEGKAVGQWFGPNTIAQVLRKLAVYDEWSNMSIHIAMDNTIIINDIKTLCLCRVPKEENMGNSGERTERFEGACCERILNSAIKNCDNAAANQLPNGDLDDGRTSKRKSSTASDVMTTTWKPVLLVIPLRLGLTDMNPMYINSLKTCLTLPQSVGFIGGKPNHAHWFVGFVGDELIYLDPHTTQTHVDITMVGNTDDSFHCPYASRIGAMYLDPSIALGFYFGSEASFDSWCQTIHKEIIQGQKTPMFEVNQFRPAHWPPFEPYAPRTTLPTDYMVVEDRQFDTSDEEFELL